MRPFQMSAVSIAERLSFTVFTRCASAIATIFFKVASISSSEPSTSMMRSASTSSG